MTRSRPLGSLAPLVTLDRPLRTAASSVTGRVDAGRILYGVYKHVLANILRSRYVARTPPLEARSPGRHSNVENAPRRRPASHAHLRYTARNVENASVTRRSLISNARTPPRKLGFALC